MKLLGDNGREISESLIPSFRGCRFVCVLVVSGLFFSGCTDSRWKVDEELTTELHALYYAAVQHGFGGITYVYSAHDYDRIKLHSQEPLEVTFNEVATKEYGPDHYEVTTETVLFHRVARHKKKCSVIVRKHLGKASFTAVRARCEVSSYWTRWNKPPTHSPGDFLFWRNDWFHDVVATQIETIKLQETLREKLGYSLSQVVEMPGLVSDEEIEKMLLESGEDRGLPSNLHGDGSP